VDIPRTSSAPRPGEIITGRYALERQIGEGGMATVFLAKDLRHERRVALKVLRPELAGTIGPERFLAEIRTTAQLQHPHILPLFDSGDAGGFLYYVMSFVEGESLAQRLAREGPLPIDEAVTIAREVADGLAHAHAAGIIHRDIKPGNVLLSGGHAILADFGIAWAAEQAGGERLTQSGIAVGTPTYMSPEQAAGDRQIDARTDLYSLGCVLYEMLVGEPPYTGPSAQAILARKATQPAPSVRLVRDAPPGLDQVVARALGRTPADRYASAAAFGAALATATGPAADAGTAGPPRTTRAIRRAVAAAAILALAAGAGWGLLRSGPVPGEADPAVARPGELIAVLPFELRGPDELQYLREGLVDLLHTRLDGVSGIRVADPHATLALLPGDRSAPVSATEARSLAERLGARRTIRGSLVSSGDRLLIRASVVNAADSAVIDVSAEGPVAGVFGLVDELVARLLAAGITGSRTQLATPEELTTVSNEALRLYLDGIRNFRRGRGKDETTALFDRAVAVDSTFALAAYWAGYTREYDDIPDAADWFRRATRHQERLPPRVRMRLAAALAGAEGRHADALGRYRLFVAQYPDDVAGWFQLAEQLAHTGHFLGEPASAARPAYERAIELDPELAPAYYHLAVIGALQADSSSLRRWASRLDSSGVDPVWPSILRLTLAGVTGDSAMLRASLAGYLRIETQWPAHTLGGAIAELAGSVMGSDPAAARWILETFARRSVVDTTRAVATRRLARLESALGRFDRAETALKSIGRVHAFLLPYDLAWVALHPAARDTARIRDAARRLRGVTRAARSREAAVRHYLLARLALALGEHERFDEEAGLLRGLAASSGGDSVDLGRDLVLELAARDALRRGEAARGLDSLMAAPVWTRDASWPRPEDGTYFDGPLADREPQFLRAELLEAMGRVTDAATWYRVAADGIWHRASGLDRLAGLATLEGDMGGAEAYRERGSGCGGGGISSRLRRHARHMRTS
jgi:tRNA A-37 threonylcarbamoyl transferase component Bud32/TolB-like protein